MPETGTVEEAFGIHAAAHGLSREQFQAMSKSGTHLRRLPRLSEPANAAVFTAFDRASAIPGTITNLSGGAIVD